MARFLIEIEVDEEQLKEEVGEHKYVNMPDSIINEVEYFLGSWAEVIKVESLSQEKMS